MCILATVPSFSRTLKRSIMLEGKISKKIILQQFKCHIIAVILLWKYSSHIYNYIFWILYIIPSYSVVIFGIVNIVIYKLEKIVRFSMRKRGFDYCTKCRNFTLLSGVEILWKHTVPAEVRANRPKFCGNCAFPQNLEVFRYRGNLKSQVKIVFFVSLFNPFTTEAVII